MKKTLFLMGLLLSVAFLQAQKIDIKKSVCVLDNQEVEEEYYFSSPTADCLAPQTLSVTISPNCLIAELKWYAPTEVLWDNKRTSNSGFPSLRFMMEEFSHISLADDFVIPPGEKWSISAVDYYGFYETDGGVNFDPPNFIGIEIYEDGGNSLPGNLIFVDPYLLPPNGKILNGQATIRLPEPFLIDQPGKYWISIYGTFESDYADNSRIYFVSHQEPIEDQFAIWDEESGDWEVFSPTNPFVSLYFGIKGSKSVDPITYNVYRDDLLLGTVTDETKYTDTGYDYSVKHTWKVSAQCPNGTESNLTNATKPPCTSVGEYTIDSFTVVPNPANDIIKITAEYTISGIEVINFLGQTVISQTNVSFRETTLDVSQLNNGVYFVRIFSENGSSIQKFVKQ